LLKKYKIFPLKTWIFQGFLREKLERVSKKCLFLPTLRENVLDKNVIFFAKNVVCGRYYIMI